MGLSRLKKKAVKKKAPPKKMWSKPQNGSLSEITQLKEGFDAFQKKVDAVKEENKGRLQGLKEEGEGLFNSIEEWQNLHEDYKEESENMYEECYQPLDDLLGEVEEMIGGTD